MARACIIGIVLLTIAACAPINPPSQYDRPYTGKLTVLRLSGAEANRICDARSTSRTGSVAGCAFAMGSQCTVVINTDAMYNQDAVLKHEIAHCNGWRGDHRN